MTGDVSTSLDDWTAHNESEGDMGEHDWRERGAVDIGRLDEQGNGEYRRTRWVSPTWESCRRCGVSRVAAEHFGWECATEQREVENDPR
jgi:hypothetical protein